MSFSGVWLEWVLWARPAMPMPTNAPLLMGMKSITFPNCTSKSDALRVTMVMVHSTRAADGAKDLRSGQVTNSTLVKKAKGAFMLTFISKFTNQNIR
jgi:hypothetical protein